MLVLTRKSEESVMVGSGIEVKVLGVKGEQVSLGFSAPKDVSIHRKEVYEAIQAENKRAVAQGRDRMEKLKVSLGGRFLNRKQK